MKQRLTNTYMHAIGGVIAALAALFVLVGLSYISKSYRNELNYMACFVFAVFTVNLEINQCRNSGLGVREYMRRKWLDAIVDVLAANVTFTGILWAAGML